MHLPELVLEFREFLVGVFLDVHQARAGPLHRLEQFVELELDGGGLAVLRALDQEDDQEREDGRRSIDDKLPSI